MQDSSRFFKEAPPSCTGPKSFSLRTGTRRGFATSTWCWGGAPTGQDSTDSCSAMAMMETTRGKGSRSLAGFVDWATMGMPDTLGATVRGALPAIASTGDCRDVNEDWAIFGKITDVLCGAPHSVLVRRTIMLMNLVEPVDEWPTFELICEVEH